MMYCAGILHCAGAHMYSQVCAGSIHRYNEAGTVNAGKYNLNYGGLEPTQVCTDVLSCALVCSSACR